MPMPGGHGCSMSRFCRSTSPCSASVSHSPQSAHLSGSTSSSLEVRCHPSLPHSHAYSHPPTNILQPLLRPLTSLHPPSRPHLPLLHLLRNPHVLLLQTYHLPSRHLILHP